MGTSLGQGWGARNRGVVDAHAALSSIGSPPSDRIDLTLVARNVSEILYSRQRAW